MPIACLTSRDAVVLLKSLRREQRQNARSVGTDQLRKQQQQKLAVVENILGSKKKLQKALNLLALVKFC